MDCADCNEAEEVLKELVVARCDASEVFELAEEPLDQIALLVEVFVIAVRSAALRPWRNDGLSALIEDGVVEVLSIIGAIGDDKAADKAIDQRGTVDHLATVARTCDQPGGIAKRIGGHMQFGG